MESEVERWQEAVVRPIRSNFDLLVRDADPSKMIDSLFAKEIIDQEDMDKITAQQIQQGRLLAARTFFRCVISKASSSQSMNAVEVCIEALINAGYGHLAEVVKKTKAEVEMSHRVCQESTPYRGRLRSRKSTSSTSGHDEVDNPTAEQNSHPPYEMVDAHSAAPAVQNWLAERPNGRVKHSRRPGRGPVVDGVVKGVFFDDLQPTRVSRLFLEIARTFEDEWQVILTILLDHKDQEQLVKQNENAPEKFRKQRLLTACLDIWAGKTTDKCGKELFDHLLQAGCDREKLEIFKRPLGLPDDHQGTTPSFPVQEQSRD